MPKKKKKKKCLVKGADKPKPTVETNATITNLHVTNSSRVSRSVQGEEKIFFFFLQNSYFELNLKYSGLNFEKSMASLKI